MASARSWLERHRVAAGAACAAVVLAAAAYTVVRTRQLEDEQRHRDVHARLVADLRRVFIDALEHAIQLRCRGDVSGVQPHVARVEEACAPVMQRYARAAEPHYMLGRMYRIQMRFDDALRLQNRAIELEPRHAGARAERALLHVQAYHDRMLWRARQLGLRHGQIVEMEKLEDATALEHKRRALEDLRHSRSTIMLGLAELIEGRPERAAALFERAVAETPQVEEAWSRWAHNNRAIGRYEAAIRIFTQAHERDLGYGPHLEGRGLTHFELGLQIQRAGSDPTTEFAQAVADYDAALKLDDSHWSTWAACADVHHAWAVWRGARGQDASTELREAAQEYGAAAERDASLREPLAARAAECRGGTRKDP